MLALAAPHGASCAVGSLGAAARSPQFLMRGQESANRCHGFHGTAFRSVIT